MSEIYRDIDAPSLLASSSSCLMSYGTSFMPELITHASGIYVYTSSGRRILDWTSGQMSTLLGHGHPEVVSTINSHASSLDHLFSGMLSPPVLHLASLLTSVLPPSLSRAMFLSTGGESNEAAIRLAKVYTGKFEIVGLGGSWHGMTAGAVGAQYHSGRGGYGPVMPGNHMLPEPNAYRSLFRHADGSYDWRTELDYGWSLVDAASCGSLCAVIMEPILSSAGMLTLPPGYMRHMKAHCERRGMLLIVDEAQTGLGRAGDLFAFEHEGVAPDILTLSKTLGNGMPLSAVVCGEDMDRVGRERGFRFYTTHVNDPLPASVGLKVLEIVIRDGLAARSKELGMYLQERLRGLMGRYGCIGDVRGRGLMAGIEIVKEREGKVPGAEIGARLAEKMLELGLSANLSTIASFGGVFRIAPPVTITKEELDEGLRIMEEAFAKTEGSMPLC